MINHGKLYIFEGVDGAGKTTLAASVAEYIRSAGTQCELLAFPGRELGTLGEHVYRIHHEHSSLGIKSLTATSLQLLHIAAHVDAIETKIVPAIEAGQTVILDRFWWSTWAYGIVNGADQQALRAMIDLEFQSWRGIQPTAAFLIRRKIQTLMAKERQLSEEYYKLAMVEKDKYPVSVIDNDGTIKNSMLKISKILSSHRIEKKTKATGDAQIELPLDRSTKKKLEQKSFPSVFSKLTPAKPTIVFDTYWQFASERQAIFFRRFEKCPAPWTNDVILREHKFTNAYRASDRVSQYLIKNVIYAGDQSPKEVFFRILIFKTFNRIATWELLTQELGKLSFCDYEFKKYDSILTTAIESGTRIYSAAYIMPSGGPKSSFGRKHRMHLDLINRMMNDDLPDQLVEISSMAKAFELLRSYQTIGDFLAYQYVTDLNYSNLTNFTEKEFVVPGPGALNGIRKCFTDLGGLNESEIIKLVMDRQAEEFDRLGLEFKSLWGRPLQLIDCQNLFCEVDKYARIAHPEFSKASGRTRIKQKFHITPQPIDYWFPPKWGLNDLIKLKR